ncbi:MAG: tRNA pseudouridine(55) synthase TruB [Planctomycetes bacterium]|nr:tRNA pseudouridine(55) synthase TruB [Planctomycetota bacterium]
MNCDWIQNLNGCLLVNKPKDISSFQVIRELSRALGEASGLSKRKLPKIGHGGTLDPFADGLMVILLGKASKLSRYLLGSKKEYRALMRFGEKTPTGDHCSDPISTTESIPVDLDSIATAGQVFLERVYQQIPPMYSAKQKDGVRLYELAREGKEIEREPCPCTIYELDVESYESPLATMRVVCSGGTYIRTLAEDLAEGMGSKAHLQALTRLASGSFALAQAEELGELTEAILAKQAPQEYKAWVPYDQILDGCMIKQVTQSTAFDFYQGRKDVIREFLSSLSPKKEGLLVLKHEQTLVATLRFDEQRGAWTLEKVMCDYSKGY